MKKLSIFIISLLAIVLAVFYGAAHFYAVDDATIAGPVSVPVYVLSEPMVAELAGTVVPLHQNPLPQIKAPSVHMATTAASSGSEWNLTTTSAAQTKSVGAGSLASVAGGSLTAATNRSATDAYAMVTPSVANVRRKTVAPVANLSTSESTMQKRRVYNPNGGNIINPDNPNQYWEEEIEGWKDIPEEYLNVGDKKYEDGVWYWWNGSEWIPNTTTDPTVPTPLGEVPWWLVAGGLLLYVWRKRGSVKQKAGWNCE